MVRASLTALLLLALVVVGCSARTDEIPIGAYLSMTGADSTFGTDTKKGIDLAIDEVNAAGGVSGKMVRVIYEDDRSLPNEATQKAQQLIDREHVVALLGEVASSRTKAGSIIAEQRKVPMITPSSTRVDLTVGREYTFRTCFTDAQQGNVAARFVYEVLGKRSVAILYAAQDTYSVGLAQVFRDDFVALGGRIVADKGYPKGETSYATYLSELAASRPDVVYAPVYYSDMVNIGRQAKAAGITGDMFVGGDAWDSQDLLDGAAHELEGAYFTNHYAPDVPRESSRRFIAAFQKTYGSMPGSIGAQGYDAAKLLVFAMRRASDLTPEKIRDAIATTKDFDGATGTLTIGADHNATKPVVIVQIQGGAFRFTREIEAAPTAVRAAGAAGAAASAPAPLAAPARDMSAGVFGAILNGLAQGAMIALVALGYTMVFGVLKMINFAHSEVFMMAAYVGLFVVAALVGSAGSLEWRALAAVIGIVVAMLAAALLGVTIERVAYRPLRARAGASKLARVAPLVTALGVSVLLQNVAQLLFTARYRSYPTHLFGDTRVVIFVTAVLTMLALEAVLRFTWFGKAMRALSQNEEAARLMGVRTSRTIAATFALGSALAAIGAVLYCVSQSEVYPTMGIKIGTQAFVAAVIGGIGSVTGAMLGGLLIGLLAELVKLTDYSGGVDVLVFAALILVLLARPTGLLGTTRAEKV